MKSLQPQSSVQALAGVGPQTCDKLARLHVHTVQDVLFHLPYRYEDRTRVVPAESLVAGQSVVIIGQIVQAKVVFGRGGRRSLLVTVQDGDAFIGLRLFYFNQRQQAAFSAEKWVRCFGEVRRGSGGLELVHPEYRITSDKPQGGMETTLTPVYPTTEGVSQSVWRKLTDQALQVGLASLTEHVPAECVPDSLKSLFATVSLADALQALHRPVANVAHELMAKADTPAHQRLIVEELLAHHFSVRRAKIERLEERATPLKRSDALQASFEKTLGFMLTSAQQRVNQEVWRDLERSKPSMRLIQGDVGSGKTVVAASAILAAVNAGVQSALMAPTELLAEQHYNTLKTWFGPLGIEVSFLANRVKAAPKRAVLSALASGSLTVVVGTHALIQDAVDFSNLGLVIIDEQHRFGVAQRLALRDKLVADRAPHQLAMTATPIPRTLAMTFYADLDVSSIDELPPGRQPVDTMAVNSATRRDEVIDRVRSACQQGRQAYWVCPIIDESESLEAQPAVVAAGELSERLSGLQVGLIHGRLSSADKDQVMSEFREGLLDVLVATTVIEVGVDVPNASLMVIENAERMGLAQLHQLRGRVGRGHQQSFCVLLYQAPLSPHAQQRIQTLRDTNDGFEIAEKDLQIRGGGELLGTRQTGTVSFRVADVMRDQALLPLIEPMATRLLAAAPQHVQALIDRWIGERENYVNA